MTVKQVYCWAQFRVFVLQLDLQVACYGASSSIFGNVLPSSKVSYSTPFFRHSSIASRTAGCAPWITSFLWVSILHFSSGVEALTDKIDVMGISYGCLILHFSSGVEALTDKIDVKDYFLIRCQPCTILPNVKFPSGVAGVMGIPALPTCSRVANFRP